LRCFDRSSSLSDLAISLHCRFQQRSVPFDLDEANELHRVRVAVKLSVLDAERDERASRESQWPSRVGQDVIFERLNEYVQGTQWSDPPVCSVCSQYDRQVDEISLRCAPPSLNLEVLCLSDHSKVRNTRDVNLLLIR
jgi:hypothetical protein